MIIDLAPYIKTCTTNVAPNTISAIVATESRSNPLALNLNLNKRLLFQPKSLNQARAWVTYLETHNYNFDVGLMQVNIKNIHKYGYHASDLLNPCTNLTIGSEILKHSYHLALNKTHNSQTALFMAISAYNSGNYRRGFYNGYVGKVYLNAQKIKPLKPGK